mmetsp:Transcript_6640/g.15912  ORF Transcript_6640/g.15912 Transcript_6640/m.15912 type:complete len:613 (-) Transcript_6640:37-1875(-)
MGDSALPRSSASSEHSDGQALSQSARTTSSPHGNAHALDAQSDDAQFLLDVEQSDDSLSEIDIDAADVAKVTSSLISFGNLQGVLRSFVGRFAAAEKRMEQLTESIGSVEDIAMSRATAQQMAALEQQVTNMIDSFSTTVNSTAKTVKGLEDNLERTKSQCNSLDQKFEMVMKEKSLQDRVIREMHDSIVDKAEVSELSQLTAMFDSYATKNELRNVVSSLRSYAQVEALERVNDYTKSLSRRFDDYARSAQVEQKLQDTRDFVLAELEQYALVETTTRRIQEVSQELTEQKLSSSRSFRDFDTKLRSLADRLVAMYQELSDDLSKRAFSGQVDELRSDLKKYAQAVDLERFRRDIVPKVEFCVTSVHDFESRLTTQDGAIQKIDTTLLDKASKTDVQVVRSIADQGLGSDSLRDDIRLLKHNYAALAESVDHFVRGEAERFLEFRGPDHTETFDRISQALSKKAEKADILEVLETKANRLDADELGKLQAVVHQQLEYLSTTMLAIAKLSLTEGRTESKTMRAQQKSQAMMQAEALCAWVLNNQPPPNLQAISRPPGHSPGSARTPTGDLGGFPILDRGRGAGSGSLFVADKTKRALETAKLAGLELRLRQ